MCIRDRDWCLAAWQADARADIEAQLNADAATMLISAEGLCYLRTPEEFATLRSLLGERSVTVLVVLRDRADFLRSYAQQVNQPSKYPDSFNYVEPDSWLARFDELVAGYEAAFGSDNVTIIEYEPALAAHGSIIPVLARAAGIPDDEIPDWQGVWSHRSKAPKTTRTRVLFALRSPQRVVRRVLASRR